MKSLIFLTTFIYLFILNTTNAQVYSPQLAGQYGQRIILYPNAYYQGNVVNGVANGVGTFYFSDGSFFLW